MRLGLFDIVEIDVISEPIGICVATSPQLSWHGIFLKLSFLTLDSQSLFEHFVKVFTKVVA